MRAKTAANDPGSFSMRSRDTVAGPAITPDAPPSRAQFKPSIRSAAVCHRASGFLARQRRTRRSSVTNVIG